MCACGCRGGCRRERAQCVLVKSFLGLGGWVVFLEDEGRVSGGGET